MGSEFGRTISELYKDFDIAKQLSLEQYAAPAFDYKKIIEAIPDFDPKDSIIGEISERIEEQNKLASQQMQILVDQNSLLANNYSKLKELYDAQAASFAATQEELTRSRRHNIIMMIIALVAMLAAIAGPIVTIIVSK